MTTAPRAGLGASLEARGSMLAARRPMPLTLNPKRKKAA
ncbi:hypothetical protein PPRY_a2618 [Pseudoalteromonas prydzensis ACAM 620]|nr:hypothetical protein [Pseudoalteromonas prydzensis ACAM 620]